MNHRLGFPAVVIAAGLVLARGSIAQLLTGTAERADGVLLIAITIFPTTAVAALADQLRSEDRHATLASLVVVRDLLEAALSVVLVVAM